MSRASAGFVVNDALSGSITTTYTSVKLTEDTAADPNSRTLPSSGRLDSLTLVVDETVATVTALDVFLTWDSTGDSPASGVTTLTVATDCIRGQTDTSLIMTVVDIDRTFRVPNYQTNGGDLYLWIKATGGTIVVPKGKTRVAWSATRTS